MKTSLSLLAMVVSISVCSFTKNETIKKNETFTDIPPIGTTPPIKITIKKVKSIKTIAHGRKSVKMRNLA